ncbi:MAG: phenylalanine--tRNA ligase subunit beta, partial [bacterium]|nr:phenylalanine--tRNA ligase subunit beta [bacterium]
PGMAPGRACEIAVDGKAVGTYGEVTPKAIQNYELERPVYLLEVDLCEILDSEAPESTFQSLAKFPPSLRDMAVLVDESVPAGEILQTAQKAGGNLLQRIDIFDIYTGKQVPKGKKSVALSLVFQSPERTLTDKNTQKMWDKILKALQKSYQAELR